MKQTLYIITLFLVFYSNTFAQDYTEYYFKFEVKDKSELDTITQIISIDNVKGLEVFAYAMQHELDAFQKLNYKIEFLQKDITKSLTMATTVAEMASWDRYPTYEVYRQMMKNFEANYPAICKLDSIGTTHDGRQLYVLKISDNVNTEENEPEFFYTSTMHGDETTGFILMLRLADSLLTTYSTSTQVENLVNEVEIYINPNANPDGTYNGGNSTVSSATRSNGYADLNRDFPDPRIGVNSPYQPETQAMMNFAEEHNFIMAANFHGGSEVMNYPWDTWTSSGNSHVDTDWFERVCTDYVTTARTVYSNYMKDVTSDGVTNGGDWYVITGGRQDYMNYWHQCREVTMEISSAKLLATENLNNFWNYNKESLLNYMNECLYGIRGIVTNSKSNPLEAMIWVINHDEENDSSMVFTDPDVGNYHRLIEPGTYDIVASAYGYISDTIRNVEILLNSSTNVNFILIDDTKYSLSGTIKDAIDDSPLENVKFRLTNAPLSSEYSNENGFYSFNGVMEDILNLIIQKEGFIFIDTNINFFNPDTIYNFELYPAKVEDFETGEFKKFNWQFSGNEDWVISDNTYEGNYSAKSGNISHGQSSVMYFNETITQDGYISFYRKVSSESGYDFLKFYIDGVEKGKWSGQSDWSIAQYEITGGIHTFKWEYSKDGNTSSGSDCAWIDYISLPANDTNLYVNPKFIFDTLNINDTSEHQFLIENTGNVTNTYSISTEQSWIELNVTNDVLNYKEIDTINFTINASTLTTGYYSSSIVVTSENQELDTVFIYLMIRDTISSNISPNLIVDTLWAGDSSSYDIVIINNGSVSLNYSVEIENSAENSWINLNQNSGNLLLTERDTIKATVNTSNIGFGEFNCNIIVQEQDEDSVTVPVFIYVKDTIISEINPNNITDTLDWNITKNYPIIIKNIGNRVLDYTVTIDYPTKSDWISLDKENGSINVENIDTIIATINTNDLPAGDYVCLISIYENDSDEFTIPVDIYVKDTIISEINPTSITDTLDQDSGKEYPVVIKNIGNSILNYSAILDFPVKSDTWISINKENGSILPEYNDTILVIINTNDIEPGDYVCALTIYENDGDNFSIPIEIYVNKIQSIDIRPEITEFKLYPNPFSDQINIEFYAYSCDYVKISMFNICGNVIFEKDINSLNNNKNNIVLNDLFNIQDIPSGIYFMQISTSNYRITKRLIKN